MYIIHTYICAYICTYICIFLTVITNLGLYVTHLCIVNLSRVIHRINLFRNRHFGTSEVSRIASFYKMSFY